MQDADAFAVRREVNLPLNLEMGATQAMLEFALLLKPDFVCLVPERREEITTEGGLDVAGHLEELRPLVAALLANGSKVSMFIDPDAEQVRASAAVGAPMIELHTGRFANTLGDERAAETSRLIEAAELAHSLGIEVHAGHGIQIANLAELAAVPHLTELNIGHTLICRAIFTGLTEAVREMKTAIDGYSW
jgi:pyridoxine 5-phosphate synthase